MLSDLFPIESEKRALTFTLIPSQKEETQQLLLSYLLFRNLQKHHIVRPRLGSFAVFFFSTGPKTAVQDFFFFSQTDNDEGGSGPGTEEKEEKTRSENTG